MTLPASSSQEGLVYVLSNSLPARSAVWRAFDGSHALSGSAFYVADPYYWGGAYPSGVDFTPPISVPQPWEISFWQDADGSDGIFLGMHQGSALPVTLPARAGQRTYNQTTLPLTVAATDGRKRLSAGTIIAGVRNTVFSRFVDELDGLGGVTENAMAIRLSVIKQGAGFVASVCGPFFYNVFSFALPHFSRMPVLLATDWADNSAQKPNRLGMGLFTSQHDGGHVLLFDDEEYVYDVARLHNAGEFSKPIGPERTASFTQLVPAIGQPFVDFRQAQEIAPFAAYTNGIPNNYLTTPSRSFAHLRITVTPLGAPDGLPPTGGNGLGKSTQESDVNRFLAAGSVALVGQPSIDGILNLSGRRSLSSTSLEDSTEFELLYTGNPSFPVQNATADGTRIVSDLTQSSAPLSSIVTVGGINSTIRRIGPGLRVEDVEYDDMARGYSGNKNFADRLWESYEAIRPSVYPDQPSFANGSEYWLYREDVRRQWVAELRDVISAFNESSGESVPLSYLLPIGPFNPFNFSFAGLILSTLEIREQHRERYYNQAAFGYADLKLRSSTTEEFVSSSGLGFLTSEQSRVPSLIKRLIDISDNGTTHIKVTAKRASRHVTKRRRRQNSESAFTQQEFATLPGGINLTLQLSSGQNTFDAISSSVDVASSPMDPYFTQESSEQVDAANYMQDWRVPMLTREELESLVSDGAVTATKTCTALGLGVLGLAYQFSASVTVEDVAF